MASNQSGRLNKADTIEKYKKHDNDSGSPEV
jgi:hypothetical protein